MIKFKLCYFFTCKSKCKRTNYYNNKRIKFFPRICFCFFIESQLELIVLACARWRDVRCDQIRSFEEFTENKNLNKSFKVLLIIKKYWEWEYIKVITRTIFVMLTFLIIFKWSDRKMLEVYFKLKQSGTRTFKNVLNVY